VSAFDTIRRLGEIAAEAADHAILADGPVTPDADLLVLCAEALHLLLHAKMTIAEARETNRAEGELARSRNRWWEPWPEMGSRRLFSDYDAQHKATTPILSRIRKLPAKTPAGIYAKALVVKASRTGAPILAMSLAEDLIACRELRESLWPAEDEAKATDKE
jgi:hypothetical protein